MTVNYKGMDKDFNYRLAEINFDEVKEQRLNVTRCGSSKKSIF